MIASLRIENYKLIESLVLDLSPLNVLVGPNGAGKSSVIEVLQIFKNMARPGFSFEEDLPKVFRWIAAGGFKGAIRVGTNNMNLGFSDDCGNEFLATFAPDERGNPKLISSLCNHRESVPLTDCQEIVRFIRGWRIHKFKDVYDLGRDFKDLAYAPGENDRYLFDAGDNLPQVLLGLKIRDEKTFLVIKDVFLEAVSDQAPDSDLVFDVGDIVFMGLAMSEDLWANSWTLPYRDWPDGWKKFLALIVSLETAGSLFVIEEPENYLHPGLINYFMELVKERVKEGLQVIITTHSPVLVNLVSDMPDSLIMMDNGRAARVTEKDKDYLRKIGKLLGTAYFGGLLDGPGNS